MTVQYIGLEVIGDEQSITEIGNWIENNIKKNDIDEKLGRKVCIPVYCPEREKYVINMTLFVKPSILKNKYPMLLKNALEIKSKNGIDSLKAWRYDNCSHDSEMPFRCYPEEVYSWP